MSQTAPTGYCRETKILWGSVEDKLEQIAKTKGVTHKDYALFNQMVPKRGLDQI